MITSKVSLAQRLSCQPNEDGDHPVIEVITNLPKGQNNSFYIETKDLQGNPLSLEFDHPPTNPRVVVATELSTGDDISFDVQAGVHKHVLWNGRTFKQKGYSFDTYGDLH